MDICNQHNILRVFYIIKIVFQIITIVLPIIIMVLAMMDIFKGVTGSKAADSLKEGLVKNAKRLISAFVIFLLPSIMNFIFTDLVPGDTAINQCFTNANLTKIEQLEAEYEAELAAQKEQEKAELEEALEEQAKKDEEERKKNQELYEKFNKNNSAAGSISDYTGSITGLSNSNMTAKTFTGSKTVDYWELVPSGISKHPALIIFLHGTGECGNLNSMLSFALPKYMNEGYMDSYDAIFIAPNTASCSWSTDATAVKELIDKVVAEYDVDEDHIIITGHSLGGVGTWHMIAKYPGFFSAAVPMSGCAFENNNSYVGIPIRNYVGASESTYTNCTYPVVNGINNLGGNAEYYALESPYDTHSTVVEIYKSSELINWMLSQ